MNYTIDYYSDDLQIDILNLPAGLLAKYLTLSEPMELHGSNLREPHTQAMGDGLFELRLKSPGGIARVFYLSNVLLSQCTISPFALVRFLIEAMKLQYRSWKKPCYIRTII